MNNSSDEPTDEDNVNKLCNKGVKPKVKNYVCNNEPQTSCQNGTASQSERNGSFQNGASCSSSISSLSPSPSSSSSSCSLNKLPCDKKNGEDSGEKCSAKGRTLSVGDCDARSQDKKRKSGCFVDNESSSGNEGEEGLSGDDCCIYTYKGDQFADLPNSLFSVDMVVRGGNQPLRENHRKANHRRDPQAEDHDRNNLGSSPEMDYLEMDFDPGPSVEQDSEEDINGFEGKHNNDSPVLESPSEQMFNHDQTDGINKTCAKPETSQSSYEPQPGPSCENVYQCSPKRLSKTDSNSNFSKTKDFLGHYCASFCSMDGTKQNCFSLNQGGTEENYEGEENNVGTANCQLFGGERLDSKTVSTEKKDLGTAEEIESKKDSKIPFDGIMLWTEQEAISKQVTLVSAEVSCAATAVINAMFALKMQISVDKVKKGISTRLKSESTSIPQYLVSRSFAGAAHENLIRGIHHASHGLLYARFFQMYPRRDIVLSKWLFHWMKKGAVPIATMNVQREATGDEATLDTRHHQMIFGVNSKGIYLTTPLECLQEEELWGRLVSPSVLRIKRSEIISRWSPETNLKPLMCQSDDRWKKMNVLGQVVNIIRESPDSGTQGKYLTQYISIPASSGITLVIPRHSPGYEELVSTADLPLLSPSTTE